DNSLRENFIFFSPFAIQFKNRSYVFLTFVNTIENLKYNFDILRNGKFITPGRYNYTFTRIGHFTPPNKKLSYVAFVEYGQFYHGSRIKPVLRLNYRLIPTAVISASYEFNKIDLPEIGNTTLHLLRLTTEFYVNNRLNWTTYFQYNTQADNININSRLQWEFQPLSYIYLVYTNNYDVEFLSKNWGLSLKVVKRFDF
ncbi:MAG: hypothetical protein AAGK97_17425, partial [Bacteroidota bacterium]